MSSTLPLFLLQAYECASPADVIAMVIRLGRGRSGGTARDEIPFKWISDEYTVEPRGVDARSTDDRRRDEILQQELQDIAQQLAQQAISFNSQHVRIVYKSVSPVSVQQPEFFNPLIKVMRRRRVLVTKRGGRRREEDRGHQGGDRPRGKPGAGEEEGSVARAVSPRRSKS